MTSRLPPAIDNFFQELKPLAKGYGNILFNYVAVRHEGKLIILRARLIFNTGERKQPPLPAFETKTVLAASYTPKELKLTPRQIFQKLAMGDIETPQGRLIFPLARDQEVHAYYDPYNTDGQITQSKLATLTLTGASNSSYYTPAKLDWELRGSSTPYENLHELAYTYTVGPMGSNVIADAIAFNVAIVNGSSEVTGEIAKPIVHLSKGLNPSKVALGYRILSQGNVLQRAMLSGDEMQWVQEEDYQKGSGEVTIPTAAVLHCFVSYDGIVQHYYWLADPTRVQNPLRAVYEVCDPNLSILNDLVANAQGKGKNAREFENAIAWLLWMLGFRPLHFGALPRTQEGLDLIVATPQGHLAVVECTTGLLKADNKLSLLVERAAAVRQQLANTNNGHLNVIPVIVTSKPQEEIKADLDQAQKLGILVIAREHIGNLISRTIVTANANQLYEEARQEVAANIAKHEKPTNIHQLMGSGAA